MRISLILGTLPIAAFLGSTVVAQDRPPIDTLDKLYGAIYGCWQPPSGTADYHVTVRVSFRRDGSVFGARKTFSRFERADADRQPVFRAVADIFERCTPLPFTRSMGTAQAGVPMVFVFKPASR